MDRKSTVLSVRVSAKDHALFKKLKRIVRKQAGSGELAEPPNISYGFAVRTAVAEYVAKHG